MRRERPHPASPREGPPRALADASGERPTHGRVAKPPILKRLPQRLILFSVSLCAGCAELDVQDAHRLLAPRFPLKEVVGFIAGFGTTFAALPDLIAMLRRRSSAGMHPKMAAIMGAFQILWVYYGLLIDSRPVVLWNVIAVGTNFLTVGAYVYFARRDGHSPHDP